MSAGVYIAQGCNVAGLVNLPLAGSLHPVLFCPEPIIYKQLFGKAGFSDWEKLAKAGYIGPKKQRNKKGCKLILQKTIGTTLDKTQNGAALLVQVGGQKAAILEKRNSEFTFDLTTGLNQNFVAANQAPAQVTFISGGKGNLTLKDVEVIYDIEAKSESA